jgi:hypothetical protein
LCEVYFNYFNALKLTTLFFWTGSNPILDTGDDIDLLDTTDLLTDWDAGDALEDEVRPLNTPLKQTLEKTPSTVGIYILR